MIMWGRPPPAVRLASLSNPPCSTFPPISTASRTADTLHLRWRCSVTCIALICSVSPLRTSTLCWAVVLGRRIACDEDAFIRKIVAQRRGGFCYELNGAFAELLRAIGFKATLLSARVPREDGSDGPEFDHLALSVDLHEPWLADVGFGDSFLEPLQLRSGAEQSQDGWTYRVVDCGNSLCVERTERDAVWKRQYSFTLTPRSLYDFAAMCHYHQTSPESPFTRKGVYSMATPEGRITVADRKLIFTGNRSREERLLASDTEWRAALKEHFAIVL